jgi:hypothetical protein
MMTNKYPYTYWKKWMMMTISCLVLGPIIIIGTLRIGFPIWTGFTLCAFMGIVVGVVAALIWPTGGYYD